ncbi:TonB-linked SusC/RagA family outer membrane protein [Mucilaginibacter lappiensis]|uniref:TonB-linked SusC/RagA family outer membrane protein n=1 Tax=Mucilaginibacter lappiensis TaxID=354630 RepID=A0ABR6PCW4_9SPHI|nr:TonB-linked SusC/RagA family outer membrane protein [Mucilaginibacter lappiensis]
MTAFMQISFAANAQKISLSKTNAPLTEVFKELRKQSGFDFLINEDQIQQAKTVSIHVKAAALTDVLNACFKDQPFTYSINNKLIIVVPKKTEGPQKTLPTVDIKISGQVLDEHGNPMPGVTVSVKGTKNKIATDKEGMFEIRVDNADAILVFTNVGMETVEVKLNNRTEIKVTLKAKSNELKEVIVNTGFQTVRQEQMTGATVTVGSTELEKRYTPNIMDNLEGRIPGLVNYRGATTIRGVSTIQSQTGALIVVDGLPIEGSIANINPYDVESITVLKDAAASAIYGIRAANGVIVITTKKAKNKRTSVEFSSDVTITQKPDLGFNMLTPSQQVDLESNFFNYQYLTGNAIATNITKTTSDITNGNQITPVQYAYYQRAQGSITQSQLDNQLAGFKKNDFRKQYTDNALLKDVLQQYNFAIRTDGNKFQSSLVLNFKGDNTGIINAYNNQLNIFYKGSYNLSKWMDVNFGVNSVLGKTKSSSSDFATDGTNVSPYMQLLDGNGKRVYYTTGDYNMYNTNPATQPRYSMLVNHLDELEHDASITKQQNTRYYVNAIVRIIPGLTFNPQFQYESSTTNVSAYSEPDSYIMRYLKNVYSSPSATTPGAYTSLLPDNGGKLATINSTGDYWTARGQLNYKRQYGKNAIDVIAGTEFRQTLTKGTSGLLLGYDDQLQSQSTTSVNFPALFAYNTTTSFKNGFNTLGLYNTYLNNPIGVIPETEHRFNSGYANATYTYDNKYNVFGSYRVDYADVFGLDKKFRGKPLWSTGLGWNISNESFMAAVDWVKFLKFRATYGVTGNVKLGVTSLLTANSTLTNAATNQPASVVTSAANPQLTWEKTATTNLGLDFSLFNNRLSGSFDWYRKKGTNIFFTKRLDASEGFTSQVINNAGLLNNGLELSLSYSWLKPGKKDGLGWTTLLVISHNNNKITYVDEVSASPVALVQGGYKVGYPVNSLYSFQYKGLNSVGQPQWLKADGTLTTVGLTGSDLSAVTYSGGTDPKNNIALTNSIYYKGFSLNMLAVYYGGQYLRAVVPDIYSGVPYTGLPSYLSNSWSPGNTNTIIPGFGQYAPGNYPGTSAVPAYHLPYSDAFVRPGDFIKIRYVAAGYQLPGNWTDKLGVKDVKLRFQLNNPKALWKKNDVNIDPETGGAPTLTSYVFGINFNL